MTSSGAEGSTRGPLRRRVTGSGPCLLHHRPPPVPGQLGRGPGMVQSVARLIRSSSQLLLLESPDTVEVYKLPAAVRPNRAGSDQTYLPRIPRGPKPSGLASRGSPLSASCPYLPTRRGSVSSVGSQRTSGSRQRKQSNLKALLEAKKSNVCVTMTYRGQQRARPGPAPSQDEIRVLQQVNGGENLCVFKGPVAPGEPFQFLSQRHRGFPFSATLYVNGLPAGRLSSCCEYRYAPGSQQGQGGRFRLAWLSGGLPCHRCTSLRNKYGSCQQLNNGTKENLIPPQDPAAGRVLDAAPPERSQSPPPSTPPSKPQNKKKKTLRQRMGMRSGGASPPSTDSAEDSARPPSKPRRRRGRPGPGPGGSQEPAGKQRGTSPHQRVPADQDWPKRVGTLPAMRVPVDSDGLRDEESLTKHNAGRRTEPGTNEASRGGGGPRDYYEECLDLSAMLERGPNQHTQLQANILERFRLKKRLASGPRGTGSDLEPSEESDEVLPPGEQSAEPEGDPTPPTEPEGGPTPAQPEGDPLEAEQEEDPPQAEPEGHPVQAEPEGENVREQELQTKLDAMMAVLNASDEVDQLVLRNTDLTDDLLWSLAEVLKRSPSQVTLLNLNLNLIGPYGAHVLLDLLRAKPQVRGVHLFGNKLRDHGLQVLVSGVVELQEQTAAEAAAQHSLLLQSEQEALGVPAVSPHAQWGSGAVFTLLELDIGGNGLASEGLRLLAAYMRHYSFLRYLGLARTARAELSAWKELFDSLKENRWLAEIVLDESNLGDPGVRMLADVLEVSVGLRQVDLDRNDVSDVGANDLMAALLCRTHCPLRHLSLQENDISPGLMRRLQEEVKN